MNSLHAFKCFKGLYSMHLFISQKDGAVYNQLWMKRCWRTEMEWRKWSCLCSWRCFWEGCRVRYGTQKVMVAGEERLSQPTSRHGGRCHIHSAHLSAAEMGGKPWWHFTNTHTHTHGSDGANMMSFSCFKCTYAHDIALKNAAEWNRMQESRDLFFCFKTDTL